MTTAAVATVTSPFIENVTTAIAVFDNCYLDIVVKATKHVTAEQVFGAVVMSLVTFTAAIGNGILLALHVRSRRLRSQMSSLFVVNLCLVDLLFSLLVHPVYIASFLRVQPVFSGPSLASTVHGYLACVLMFASVLATSAISVERFYCIRLPMHHAGHVTVCRACAVIVFYVWVQAVVLASPPARFGWSVFMFRDPQRPDNWDRCNPVRVSANDLAYRYVLFVTVLCFLVPGLIVLSMYCSIYRVARQAANQIHPALCDPRGHVGQWDGPSQVSIPPKDPQKTSQIRSKICPVQEFVIEIDKELQQSRPQKNDQRFNSSLKLRGLSFFSRKSLFRKSPAVENGGGDVTSGLHRFDLASSSSTSESELNVRGQSSKVTGLNPCSCIARATDDRSMTTSTTQTITSSRSQTTTNDVIDIESGDGNENTFEKSRATASSKVNEQEFQGGSEKPRSDKGGPSKGCCFVSNCDQNDAGSCCQIPFPVISRHRETQARRNLPSESSSLPPAPGEELEAETRPETSGSKQKLKPKADAAATDKSGSSSSNSPSLPVRIFQEDLMAGHRASSRRRALGALAVILGTFVALWSPYFIVNLYLASIARSSSSDASPSSSSHLSSLQGSGPLELVTLWIGLSSAAVNVFVYGLMIRSIREELVTVTLEICYSFRHVVLGGVRGGSDDDRGCPGNEDFFEFLERTSTQNCRNQLPLSASQPQPQ